MWQYCNNHVYTVLMTSGGEYDSSYGSFSDTLGTSGLVDSFPLSLSHISWMSGDNSAKSLFHSHCLSSCGGGGGGGGVKGGGGNKKKKRRRGKGEKRKEERRRGEEEGEGEGRGREGEELRGRGKGEREERACTHTCTDLDIFTMSYLCHFRLRRQYFC